jgi:hypothetical protein
VNIAAAAKQRRRRNSRVLAGPPQRLPHISTITSSISSIEGRKNTFVGPSRLFTRSHSAQGKRHPSLERLACQSITNRGFHKHSPGVGFGQAGPIGSPVVSTLSWGCLALQQVSRRPDFLRSRRQAVFRPRGSPAALSRGCCARQHRRLSELLIRLLRVISSHAEDLGAQRPSAAWHLLMPPANPIPDRAQPDPHQGKLAHGLPSGARAINRQPPFQTVKDRDPISESQAWSMRSFRNGAPNPRLKSRSVAPIRSSPVGRVSCGFIG